MPIIELNTLINAPMERCFLLSLSVDVHMSSTSQTKEKAVAGITQGVMSLNDTVTWQARHLGIRQHLTSKITVYEKPVKFVDEMLKGPFKKLYHQHLFKDIGGSRTLMTDIFEFQAPLGVLGKLAEMVFLTGYMKKFLEHRNAHIRQVAESTDWKRYLDCY